MGVKVGQGIGIGGVRVGLGEELGGGWGRTRDRNRWG